MLHLLLTAAVPFQRLVDKVSPTHGFINLQALAILQADGRTEAARWLSTHLGEFDAGCDWADGGWRNFGHMYNPETDRGFKGWPSATELVREYWEKAAEAHRKGDGPNAAFWLGASVHLVQDLCVPHHAAARLFDGHKGFEEYARRYRHRFAAHSGGLYGLAQAPEGWVVANAEHTLTHFAHCLTDRLARPETHFAVANLLPRAQQSTAGFVSHFLACQGVA